jgi:hypothetical protein
MEIAIIIWLVLAALAAILASSRGRNGAGWFLLTLIISPIISIILLAILKDLKTAGNENTEEAAGKKRKMRTCPHCAEEILARASRCKHCGADVEPTEVIDPNETQQQKAERFGIWRDSGQYIYGKFRYSSIEEAISVAEKEN